MKRNSRVIAIIVAAVMLMSTAVSFAGTKIYTAHHMFSLDDSAESVDFAYSDAWLQTKSTKYNNKLAIASMGLAMAAGSQNDINISQLLSDMGFKQFKSNYATKEEKNDNVCVSYAMKKSGKYVIIPVVIRGSHYTKEWVDNFNAGTSGDAKGYSSAAKSVADYVKTYISDNGIAKSKVRLWIIGYSRGGAIADLAAESLTSKYGKARVCAYCFESPMTNKGNAKKTNIHHVRNKYDGVVCVLPSYMGFGIAGKVNKIIGGGSEAAMKKALKKVVKEDVDKLYESPKKFCWANVDTSLTGLLSLSQGKIICNKDKQGDAAAFWKLVIKRIKKVIPNRKKYTSVYSSRTNYAAEQLGVKVMTIEESFMAIMRWYHNLSDSQKAEIANNLGGAVSDLSGVMGLTDFMSILDDEDENFNITNSQYTAIVKAISDALGGDNELKGAIAGGLDLVIDMIETDLASDRQILGSVLYEDATGRNIDRLINPHRPEIAMAWLMASK